LLLIDNVAPDDDECAVFLNTLEKLRDPSHVRCASIQEWETWLKDAGLRIRQTKVRRKSVEFRPWVQRMAVSDDHGAQVEAFVLAAPEHIRLCFDIAIVQDRVESITVDEWMVLCERT
jgi:hypothetical protein